MVRQAHHERRGWGDVHGSTSSPRTGGMVGCSWFD